MRILYLLLICTLFAPLDPVCGQSFKADTAFVAQAKGNAIKLYTTEVGVNSNFYNGSEYNEYSPQTNEHPYLFADWKYGSVNYGDERYDNVPLLFDIAEDQIITAFAHGNSIRLVRDKVQSFHIDDMTFVKISNAQLRTGFYQLVYDGKTKFLIHRQKTFYTELDGNVLRNAFDQKVDYYLIKDGTVHPARSERAFLAPLSDKKQAVKKFIRERSIRYNKNREQAAYAILQYYDQITP